MSKGIAIGYIIIGLFIVNMVYVHIGIRECNAQVEPGVHHDWKEIINNYEKNTR